MAQPSRSLTRKLAQTQGLSLSARVGIFNTVQNHGNGDITMAPGVNHLTAEDLDEVKQLKHPPEVVRRVLELVYLVLAGKPPVTGGVPWDAVMRTLAAPNFRQRLDDFDVENLNRSPEVTKKLCDVYLDGIEPLTHARVLKASRAAAALFGWSARTLGSAGAFPAIHNAEPAIQMPHPFMPCPGGHTLQPFTPNGNFRCNVCRASFAKGLITKMIGCRECDYDLCDKCVDGKAFEVVLCRSKGEQLGLEMRKRHAPWPKVLRIERIDDVGVANRWNARTSDYALREGDFVYCVNGENRNAQHMLDACNSDETASLTLSVFRRPK